MKKMNYVRPLAEVIEIEVTDIITKSVFSETAKQEIVDALAKAIEMGKTYDAGVNDGSIKLN